MGAIVGQQSPPILGQATRGPMSTVLVYLLVFAASPALIFLVGYLWPSGGAGSRRVPGELSGTEAQCCISSAGIACDGPAAEMSVR